MMLTTFRLLLLCFSTFVLASCNFSLDDDNTEKAWERLKGIENIMFLKDKDGVVYEAATFQDDVRHGISETYYSDGKIESRKEYVKGLRQEQALYYYHGGELHITIDFVDDIPHGKYHAYYEDGTTKRTKDFVGGLPVGTSIAYFANKNIQSVQHFVNGRLHGEVLFYKPDGSLEKTNRYVKGALHETKYPKKN